MEDKGIIDPVIERIEQELRLHGRNQADLCRYLGLPRQSFTKWKNGNMQIPEKRLKQIAEYFDMTVNELRNEECRRVKMDSITPMERVILRCYRSLDTPMRKWFITTLRLATKESLRPEEEKVKPPKATDEELN